jgi:release factor H-coupled RctB family protein
MLAAIGMPDLHPGANSPIGAVFVSRDRIYPALVGNDIGCGVGLWQTDLQLKKNRLGDWAERLRDLDGPWAGDGGAWLAERDIEASEHDHSLGTIGGGNHFAELQRVEQIVDPESAATLGLDPDRVQLCVHSGSRGLGGEILRAHVERHGGKGLEAGGEEARLYAERHEHARRWAVANRSLIAHRISQRLKSDARPLSDICHNSASRMDSGGGEIWLHRKGAAPSDKGPLVIPGSRGDFSYLVQPVNPRAESGFSLAHGAGRKWSRSECRGRLEKRFRPEDLERTPLGGQVICEDRQLLFEEAPQAYKNIDAVIESLVAYGLARVIAVLRPLVTYKVRR